MIRGTLAREADQYHRQRVTILHRNVRLKMPHTVLVPSSARAKPVPQTVSISTMAISEKKLYHTILSASNSMLREAADNVGKVTLFVGCLG